MVDIDLYIGKPVLQVQFRPSLAADMLNVLNLLASASSIEGFDTWVYATYAALSPALRAAIDQVLVLTQKSNVISSRLGQIESDHPAHTDFAALIAWLDAFTEQDFENIVADTLQHLDSCCSDELDAPLSLDDVDGLRSALATKFDDEQLDRALHLIHNPVELKAQFISVLARFWERFYREEIQRCRPLMQRSAENHRRQNYRGNLSTVFSAVTGRRMPEMHFDPQLVERVVFIPSAHIGPYITAHTVGDPPSTLTVHYNCRPTGALESDETPVVRDLFPPLKALADETRLQILSLLDGRELYAQEIVARLDITQSAVSRHLKLMVIGDLLTVRKKDSMKYFAINEDTLEAVAESLKKFRAKTV